MTSIRKTPASQARLGKLDLLGWLEPSAVFTLGLLSFISWTIYAGPDLNWDLLNYHLYIGLHASGDALTKDFFPAFTTSYLAPYAYWPLAKMVAAKWPSMVIGAVLATIHSFAVLATWFLARQLIPGSTTSDWQLRALSVVLGVACPLVIIEIGTSFIDITAAIPILIGFGFILRALSVPATRHRDFAIAGVCFGVATGLKLTGVPFTVAAGAALLVLWCIRTEVRLTSIAIFAAGVVAGFVTAYGIWGYQLWREFQNPFFPLFHSFFQPPDAAISASAAAIHESKSPIREIWDWFFSSTNRHQRFIPRDIGDWLLRPLYMVDPVANVYTEVRAPDARFLLLFCLMPLAAWKLRSQLGKSNLAALMLIFVTGWVFWMATSGNGRYMMPLAIAAGPLIVASAAAIWPRGGLVAVGIATLLICVQAAFLIEGTQFRWGSSKWQNELLSAKLPPRLLTQPATFVTFDGQSASWLSAFVHPESRFANPGAPPVRGADGKLRDKFEDILRQSSEITAIFRFFQYESDGKVPFPKSPQIMAPTAEVIGLSVDFTSCEPGHLDDGGDPRIVVAWDQGRRIERIATQGYFFCRAKFDPRLKRAVPPDATRDLAISKIEQACPLQFPVGGASTVCASKACWRTYAATDTTLIIADDGAVLGRYYGAFQEPYLGNIVEIAEGRKRIACHEQLGRYAPWSPGENLLAKPLDRSD